MESGRDNGVEADGCGSGREAATHHEKGWRDAASREWRCNWGDRAENRDADAMEWQDERASERPGEPANDRSRKRRNVREEKDRETKYKLLVHNRDKLKITTRLRETERTYGEKMIFAR